jgi:hypothetical protein
MDDLLFHAGDLRGTLELEGQKVASAVEAVPEEHVMQAEAEEWAAALVEEVWVHCPELDLANVWRDEPQDIRIDVGYDPGRSFFPDSDTRIAGTRIVVHIPFKGDPAVFQLHPSEFTFNPPRGRVHHNELLLTIEYPNDSPRDIDQAFNGFIGPVQQWLGWAKGDIDSFNNGLERLAISAIAARQQRIKERDEHLAKSAIPIGRSGGQGKTRVVDAIVRRPAPKLPQSHESGVALEPTLRADVFEHIVGVIRMQSAELMRSPGTYNQLDEEARRDLYLATLNTHYAGRGSAEAFNKRGKTDILIRWDDSNLFIAEFKFWAGIKGFAEMLKQLFGYATWRDTKLAAVVFVKEKGLTEIIEKAREFFPQNELFVGWQDAPNEVELRLTMRLPGDERRLADLAVFFVHTPA